VFSLKRNLEDECGLDSASIATILTRCGCLLRLNAKTKPAHALVHPDMNQEALIPHAAH
jgi:hypothetical protein